MDNKQRIFISYTLRDSQLNKDTLKKFKHTLDKLENIESYIDILDNKNVNDPQNEVFRNLSMSSIVWVIKSDSFIQSPWVIKELSFAVKVDKPIFYWNLSDVYLFLKLHSPKEIQYYINNFI